MLPEILFFLAEECVLLKFEQKYFCKDPQTCLHYASYDVYGAVLVGSNVNFNFIKNQKIIFRGEQDFTKEHVFNFYKNDIKEECAKDFSLVRKAWSKMTQKYSLETK